MGVVSLFVPAPAPAPALLAPHEPAPFRVTDGNNLSFLIVCDHAGHRVPERLGDLGMEEADRLDHIGWDPGAGDERAFLEAYYTQLRARLEGGMRLGRRKADKWTQGT